jgi:hypothetical protein
VIDQPATPSGNGGGAPPPSSNAGTKDGDAHCGSGSVGVPAVPGWIAGALLLALLLRKRP